MTNQWVLFVLLSIRINELIKAVDAIKLEEYREYVTLVSDVQEYFKVSSVFIVYPGSDDNLETTTLMYHLMRQFSGKQVLSLTLNYTSVALMPHNGRIIKPLYVVLLDTPEHVEHFRQVTRRCQMMSYPFWLLIFTRPMPEICGSRAKVVDNFFYLRFDTEMVVKCHGDIRLTEWYALHENSTKIQDLGTWDVYTGLKVKSSGNVFERRHNLHGKLMRIATTTDSHFVLQEGHAKSGFFSAILTELNSRLNFTIKVEYEDDLYGMYNESTGNWSGVIGRLQANEVDFGVGEFSMTAERLNVVDFTLPIMLSRTQLYMKEPDGSTLQWAAYFRVYGVDVWIVTEVLIIFTALMIIFIRIKVQEKPLPPDHISENCLCVWGIYCQQSMPNFPTALPMRIAYFSILVSSIIFLAIYSACLISYLTLKNPSLPFSTLEGFVSDGSYKLITLKESADYRFFSSSTNVVLKKMMKMMANPETLPKTMVNGFTQACSGKVAFYTTEAIKSQINAQIPCDLVYVETGKIDSLGMILRKKSQYTRLINYHLQKFRDMGIMTRLRSKLYVKVTPVENKYIAVSFKGIMTILVILCIGASLSLIILIVEILIHRHQINQQNRNLT